MPERESRTILLVDNSASILFYLAMLLKRLDYSVVTARSAEDALRLMDSVVPSLILAELSLPRMSGIQFLEQLKKSGRLKTIPAIVLTSDRDPATKDACMRLGCAAYLVKPAEPDVLYRTLQAVSESVPRMNIRLSASLQVIVGDDTVTGGARRTERATAISEGGLFIRTLYPQPRNALTPLQISINDRTIKAKAVVLYTYALGEGAFKEPGMGMKFVELSDTDRALIRDYIREQLTGDITPQENGTAQ